jgi:inner membrane protein
MGRQSDRDGACSGLPYGEKNARSNAIFLPKALRITGEISTQDRQRGIFHVPIYQLNLKLEGEFEKPGLKQSDWIPIRFYGISHISALGYPTCVRSRVRLGLPGMEKTLNFFKAPKDCWIPYPAACVRAASPQDTNFKFSFPLSLNGSDSVFLTPFAEETVVNLSGNSAHPEFQGTGFLRNEQSGTTALTRPGEFHISLEISLSVDSHVTIKDAVAGSHFGVKLNPLWIFIG